MTREDIFKLLNKHQDNDTLDIKTAKEMVNIIFDNHEAQLKAKDEEIDRTKSYIEKLWQIVDDIDTYGDMAKSDDAMFRSLVENKQKERWELPSEYSKLAFTADIV